MIVVTATLTAKPGQEDALRQACAAVLAPTKAEAGCVQYECAQNIEDPSQFLFVEAWEDMDALKAHTMTEHMAVFGPLAESLSDAQVIDAHFVDKSRRLKPREERSA